MEWLTSIRKAINYMEEHLEDNISAQDVAKQVFMSSFFFQKGFSLMTGYGLSEYIRNRRLYKAALDLRINDIRFKGKRSVDWDDVKGYLEEYVGQFFQIASSEDGIVERYNVFYASLLIRHDNNGKMYLYDVIDIKKETSNPLES